MRLIHRAPTSGVRAGLALHGETRDHASAYAVWDNVLVCIGIQPPDLPAVRTWHEQIRKLAARHPEGIVLFTVIQSTSTPRPEARDALKRLMRDEWSHISAAVFVVEGQGFAAAAQRAIASALIIASGVGSKIKITTSPALGLDWVNRHRASSQLPVLGPGFLLHVHRFARAESQLAVVSGA